MLFFQKNDFNCRRLLRTCVVDLYPCHVNYTYDEKQIHIFIHHTDSVCPFDAIEELDTLKLEFKNLSNWSYFYVRQRKMTKCIDRFRDELELVSFNLDK